MQKQLDDLNVSYDKRWGIEKLQGILAEMNPMPSPAPEKQAEEQVKTKEEVAVAEITHKSPTTDDIIDGGERTDEGVTTKGGIFIPTQVLASMGKTTYKYKAECNDEKCSVYKIDARGSEQFVREYNIHLHGERFEQLAIQFCKKKTGNI